MRQFILGAVCGAACIALIYPTAQGALSPESYKALDRFSAGFSEVRRNYLQQPSDDKLIDGALQGMVSGLDPHSSYMTENDYAQARNPAPAGIGLEMTVDGGFVKVIAPIEGSPADTAGIKSGDVIAAINGNSTEGMRLDEAAAALRGDTGSKVTLTLVRLGAGTPIDITMLRAPVHIPSVRYERKGSVGYLRISSFTEGTSRSLEAGVSALKKQIGPDLKGYIIDLRHNPGGLLEAGRAVGDDFLSSGVIVSTKGRNPQDSQTYSASPGDIADGKPIIVLVDEGSAAASEIVAAALQDNHRATILGMRSFGEGTVQTIIPVGDNGGALRLTTAQFFTPSGRPIQVAGVTPDIVVAQSATHRKIDALHTESGIRGHIEGPEPAAPASVLYPPSGNTGDFQLAQALGRLGR